MATRYGVIQYNFTTVFSGNGVEHSAVFRSQNRQIVQFSVGNGYGSSAASWRDALAYHLSANTILVNGKRFVFGTVGATSCFMLWAYDETLDGINATVTLKVGGTTMGSSADVIVAGETIPAAGDRALAYHSAMRAASIGRS